MTLLIVVTTITVLGSLVCSLCESTLLSLSMVRLKSMVRQGKKYAKVWLKLKKDIDRPISAILIINTICNTGGAALAGSLFGEYFGSLYIGFFMAGLTLVILYLSEIGPKVFAAIYAEQLAPILGNPLMVTTWLMAPLVFLTTSFSSHFRSKTAEKNGLSSVDLEVLAQLARSTNIIAFEQERIILNAVKLNETHVKEAMIPREFIVFFQMDLPPEANLQLGQQALHTRYPISHSENPDDIMGYINYKDLIGFHKHGNDLRLESFIRPILIVQEDLDLNSVLKQLTAKHHHIAMVKNKEDKVVGLVSLEDIIEELVGEIEDEFEFDQSANTVIPITEGLWRIGAALTLNKVAAIIEQDLPMENPRQSLGQWLVEHLGKKHLPGMTFQWKDVRFTIQQARRGKIYQVIVETHLKTNESPPSHASLEPIAKLKTF